MKHSSSSSAVPAFLTKLWTLVEDEHTNHLICWSQEGNSFLVLDEQRFSKEILPKFFKHNNMASFVRQLNMYGFRKVMHIDSGIVKQERDGPIEFQHPYFRHGRDDLLENIKRKVSNTRPEDNKLRQEDLSKILSSVQTVHDKQETMDVRLATLKRENEALWREMSTLRQKHAQQQQAIKELVQFILTLVQNNRLLNLKRKRPLLLNGNGKKSKFISQIFEEPVEQINSAVSGFGTLKNSDITDDVVIFDATDEEAEVTVDTPRTEDDGDGEVIEVNHESTEVAETAGANATEPADSVLDEDDSSVHSSTISTLPACSSLQLSPASTLIQEDPVKMMDSILRESGTISQNINLLGKVELMDYLDSIDCSLEDFQAMLYGKQFSVDALQGAELNTKDQGVPNQAVCDHAASDKRLVQYTSCPLLAFLDDCNPQPKELSQKPGAEDTMDLLDSPLETPRAPRGGSMIRLEPLTEAEASEATLFYLCELNSDLQPNEPPQLDI